MKDSHSNTDTEIRDADIMRTKEKLLAESVSLFLNHPGVPQEWKDALKSNQNIQDITSLNSEVKSCKE